MKTKRLLAAALCAVMVLSMTACSKRTAEMQTTVPISQVANDEFSKLNVEELLNKCIKDQKNITLEEYLSLLSTLSYAKITDKLELENNATTEALNMLSVNKAVVPDAQSVINSLIGNESPQVRGFAVQLMGSLTGVSGDNLATLKELIKTEKEPYVIRCMIDTLAYDGGKDADVGSFFVNMTKNENAAVRLHAAIALGSEYSKGVDGAVDAIIALMSDSDADVRKAAYKLCGKLGDEKVIEPVVKMLGDEKSANFYSYGIMGLCSLWYDYPNHANTSEAAYKATIYYFKKAKHSEKALPPGAVLALAQKNSKGFDDWKKKASYYNASEIVSLMTELVKASDLSWSVRTAAIRVIAIHGTKAELEALGKTIDSLKDDQAKFVKGEYEKILKTSS